MIIKKKKAVDFTWLETYKNPLLCNNFRKLSKNILLQKNKKINKKGESDEY